MDRPMCKTTVIEGGPFAGLKLVADPSIPPGVIYWRDNGTLGVIILKAPPPPAKSSDDGGS